MDKKISVVTVVYNDVHNIEKTLLSVLNQSYPDIEYIVIDGKSTDGTWEIISRYKEQIAYSISEADKGIYDAMNKAIKVATGEWIIFMNCGDSFYAEDTIRKIFNGYKDNGESIVYGDCFVTNSSSKQDHRVVARAQESKKDVYQPSFHQAIFTRTSEMKKNAFDTKYRIIADFAFFYDLYQRNHKWHYTNSIICNYDYTGLSAKSRKLIMKEYANFYASRHRWGKALWYMIVYLKRCITN
jgi:glycosyltransferase involved in cell wall biosynthesis